MELYVWNWDKIAVLAGGWWLFLILIGLCVLNALIGFWAGYRNAKYRYETWPTDHLDRPREWGGND